jgi:nucleotide-binding universal stress UspA family protein
MIKLNAKKILVPVDFSENALHALEHAAFLASLHKGEIILSHIIHSYGESHGILGTTPEIKKLSGATGKIIEKKMREIGLSIRKKYGVKTETVISTGGIATEIVTIAETEKAGLIVMGTHGYSAVEEFLLGSNALSVLNKSSCPVMTIRKNSNHLYKRIVLPIDLSEHSRQKVNLSFQLADRYGANIYVLGILGRGENDQKGKMETILRQIEKAAKNFKANVKTELVEKSKNRSYSTVQYCKKVKGDLIVIMSDQETEFSGLLLGPYAHQVINHAPVPVLCIKPEENSKLLSWTSAGTFSQ